MFHAYTRLAPVSGPVLAPVLSLALFLTLALAPFSPASAAAAPKLETELQKNYEQIKGFKASFTQRLTHRESGSVEERKGTLLFQKPLLVRWETAKPHAEVLIVTPREIWDYLPDEEVAYRYAPQLVQDSRSLIQVITGQARLDEDFSIKAEGEEQGLSKLRLYPKDPTPELVEAVIWVDAKARLIRKALIVDFYGNTNEVAFSELTPNATLPTNSFSFTPPKGVEVEDRMDKEVQERPLFQ